MLSWLTIFFVHVGVRSVDGNDEVTDFDIDDDVTLGRSLRKVVWG